MSACINLFIFVASQIVKVSQTHIEIKHTSRRTSKTTVIEFGFIKSTTPFCKMRVGSVFGGFFDFSLRFYMFKETDFFCLADFRSGCFLIFPEGLPTKRILPALQSHQWYDVEVFFFFFKQQVCTLHFSGCFWNRKRADQSARLQGDLPQLDVSSKRVSVLLKDGVLLELEHLIQFQLRLTFKLMRKCLILIF